jgi:polyhydroxybutyrate depolymerase
MRRGGSGIVAAAMLVAALALSACSAGEADRAAADRADADDEAARAACDPPRPAVATEAPQSFRFGDQTRAYLLALPAGYDGTTAYPLVLSFHGFSGNKEGQNAYAAMAGKGTARGYFDAHPGAGDTGGHGT